MSAKLLRDSDIKVVYDSQGVKRGVLIDYDKFEEIVEFLERHEYFYSESVQERLRKSEEDFKAGRYVEVTPADVDKATEWLNG